MRSVLTAVLVSVVAVTAGAAQSDDVADHAKKSDRVVVGVVEDVSARFGVNDFGDRLIVSDVWLRVQETLKGAPQNLVPVEVEGGTVGDLTLRVSDLPVFQKGDRAVFLLDAVAGRNRLHGRGKGVLKLDRSDRVAGTDLRLSDIRASVRASQK
jgi:hypothetical protein